MDRFRPILGCGLFSALATLSAPCYSHASASDALRTHDLKVEKGLRVLVVVPHPDDESIAAGGLIQKVRSSGGEVRVVFVTSGDGYADAVKLWKDRNNLPSDISSSQDYLSFGTRRMHEALAAVRRLGMGPFNSNFFGFPDGGISHLWFKHLMGKAYTSPFTSVSESPYGHPYLREYTGLALTVDLIHIIRSFRPDWVVSPNPMDFHLDHCAVGLFTQRALIDVQAGRVAKKKPIRNLQYLVHYPDYPSSGETWVRRLPTSGICGSSTGLNLVRFNKWYTVTLSHSEIQRKISAISEHQTQMLIMAKFLMSLAREKELFSESPDNIALKLEETDLSKFKPLGYQEI